MSERNVTPALDTAGGTVYLNPAMLGRLATLTMASPHATTVMFFLMARMAGDGTVRVTQATLAKQCDSTLQQVEKAIVDLADAGWISSVNASAEPGGALVCVINPELAMAEQAGE